MRHNLTCALIAGVVIVGLGACSGKGTSSSPSPSSSGQKSSVVVSGPTKNGKRPNAFGAADFDLASYGYVQQEYFIQGVAHAFGAKPGTKLGSDGHWRIAPTRSASYKTRILVTRPRDPARFSGNVVVSWANVTSGFELTAVTPETVRDGDAQVSVSAQKVGLDGFPGGAKNALRGWDPVRYGSLHHPGDDFSFDIFTQAAQAVGPNRATTPVDPMAGLAVKHVFATAASQSAIRLTSYLDGVQPIYHVFDGVVLLVNFGTAASFTTPTGASAANSQAGLIAGVRIRDDLGIPVILVTTESEASSLYPVRQPDTKTFRTWEIAGAAHVGSGGSFAALSKLIQRDGLSFTSSSSSSAALTEMPNSINWLPVIHSAQVGLDRWVSSGAPPPSFPLIDFSGKPPQIVRDQYGNADGGIRMPELVAPVATYKGIASGGNQLAALLGSTKPFSAAQLRALYEGRADYLAKYDAAVDHDVSVGVFLAEDAAGIKAAAATATASTFPS
jgi:hypothetical protein